MGIRFNRIKSVEIGVYDAIWDVSQFGEAVLLGGEGDPRALTICRYDEDKIFKKKFETEYRITFSKKHVKLRTFDNQIIAYGANEEGNVLKYTINAENFDTSEEFYSPTLIREINYHPTENALLIFNKEGLNIIEDNYTLPITVSSSTIRDTELIFQKIDGVNHFFVATLEGEIEEKSYLRIAKTQEIGFASNYTAQVKEQIVVGVWKNEETFTLAQAHYFAKHDLFSFTLKENVMSENKESQFNTTSYYTFFFTKDLERMTIDTSLEKANEYMLAEDRDKILIIHSENQSLTCAYDYNISGVDFSFQKDSEFCIENWGLNITNEQLSIEGQKYPVFAYGTQLVAVSWDLKERKLEYLDWYLTDFSTEKPDGLIQTTYDGYQLFELHEYNIVPISVGGIVGFIFGILFLICLTACFVAYGVPAIKEYCEQRAYRIGREEEQNERKKSKQNQKLSNEKLKT